MKEYAKPIDEMVKQLPDSRRKCATLSSSCLPNSGQLPVVSLGLIGLALSKTCVESTRQLTCNTRLRAGVMRLNENPMENKVHIIYEKVDGLIQASVGELPGAI